MPTVSIIVPFKDAEKYLEKCINSLKKQNYNNYEIVLVNDDYDGLGVGNARNEGIKKAKGKYIMFVDVDDFIEEDLIKNLEPYIKQEIDIIKYKMKICDDNKVKNVDGPVFKQISGEEAFNRLCFEDKYFDSPCLYLIKKEYFLSSGLEFPKNAYHEDFAVIPLLIAKAKMVVSTNFFGYNYIQTEDSIMRNNDYSKKIIKVDNKIEHYTNMMKIIKSFDISSKTKENLSLYYTNSIILSLKELKKEDRKIYEKKIKQMKMIKDIKCYNLKQLLKKIILNINIELYLKWKGL